MRGYKPKTPFNVPMKLLTNPIITKDYGVVKKSFTDGGKIFGSFRTFGGTERDVNGVYTIEDTAVIETWFRPDIKSDCRITVLSTGVSYDIIGTPENINMQNQYLQFKVIAVKGGA